MNSTIQSREHLTAALFLDAFFPPALSEQHLSAGIMPDPPQMKALIAAFTRGFPFAGYL